MNSSALQALKGITSAIPWESPRVTNSGGWYEKITRKFLAEGWIVYLYHPQYLIAHTDRLEGFVPMADGLPRVIGLKLK